MVTFDFEYFSFFVSFIDEVILIIISERPKIRDGSYKIYLEKIFISSFVFTPLEDIKFTQKKFKIEN